MRFCALVFIGLLIAVAGSGQTVAAVPADAHELVTGAGGAVASAADATQALQLLNRAKRPMRLLAPMTPPYLLSVSFTATGEGANSGTGELSQLWLAGQQSRWTASMGNFSLSRVRIRGEAFDEKPVTSIPMRIHMLRNTIFWAAGTIPAGAKFRSAAVEWNNAPTTCLLMSDGRDAAASPARQWNEEEFCIDDRSGLLQILSFAPGNYTVYSYAKGQSFHGQPMPDRITTWIAGTMAIDASFSIDDPEAGDVPQTPTSAMIANGPPTGLQDPAFMKFELPSAKVGTGEPVIVNAQVGPSGKVLALEVCAAADGSLGPAALEAVRGMSFGPSDAQRQFYVEVVFTPTSNRSSMARPAGPATTRVPLEAYYLERSGEDADGKAGSTEIHARRSDGATMWMMSFGPRESKKFTRELRFPDGRSVTVYDEIKAKVTWPLPGPIEMKFLREGVVDGPSDCAAGPSATLLRHDQIEGQDVDVIQSSAGDRRITIWAAPKLGCEGLRVRSEAPQGNGEFRTLTETRTTRLVMGEPEARWFEIAPDLVEMKPSEAQRKLWESMDLHLSAEDKAAMLRQLERQGATADARYLKK